MNPIISLQNGGDISSLFVDYKPFIGLQEELPAATKSEKTTNTEKDSTDGFKELLGLLKELNGLPGDTAYISSHIERLYSRAIVLGNGEISRKELVSTYLKALRSIRQALHSKEEYKSVRQNITSKHGENEVAIDNHGNLFVLDINTGEIKNMSPEQYNKIKSRGQYQALTNSNLLHYRANDPQFAFNDNILQVVANGTSMEEINKYLTDITSKLGTTALKREGYSEVKANGIISGMALLEKAFQQGMTVEGLYHQGVLTKDQTELAKLALEYLWKTLPSNAKALLKVKGGSTEGAIQLVQNLVFSTLDFEQQYPQSLDTNPTEVLKAKAANKQQSEENADKSNPYFNIVKLIGAILLKVTIRNKNGVLIDLDGANYASLPDMQGKPVETTSVDDLLNRGLAGIVTDRNAISFGNLILKSDLLKDFVYDNSGGTMVTLPCKVVDNHVVVDLSIMDAFKEAQDLINELPNPTEEQKAEIYADRGLLQLVDQLTGKLNKSRFALFLLVDVYGIDKDDFIKDTSFVEQVTDLTDDLKQRIANALSTDSKNTNYKIDWKDKWIFEGHSDKIYKGVMYIPITYNELQAKTAFELKVTDPYGREGDYQQIMKMINANSASSSALNYGL